MKKYIIPIIGLLALLSPMAAHAYHDDSYQRNTYTGRYMDDHTGTVEVCFSTNDYKRCERYGLPGDHTVRDRNYFNYNYNRNNRYYNTYDYHDGDRRRRSRRRTRTTRPRVVTTCNYHECGQRKVWYHSNRRDRRRTSPVRRNRSKHNRYYTYNTYDHNDHRYADAVNDHPAYFYHRDITWNHR